MLLTSGLHSPGPPKVMHGPPVFAGAREDLVATSNHFKLQAIFSNADTGKDLSFGLWGHGTVLSDPLISAIGPDVVDWWNTSLGGNTAHKAWCDADTALTKVTLEKRVPADHIINEYTTGLPIAGTAAGDQYAGQVAVLMSLRTARSGRSYRGRCYLPPVNEAVVQANAALLASTALDMASQFKVFLDTLTVDAFVPEVYSLTLGSGEDITYVLCDRLLRTQRRRQDRATEYEQGV